MLIKLKLIGALTKESSGLENKMIYDFTKFEFPLKVRDFTRQDQRSFSLLLESPKGVKSRTALLHSNHIENSKYVDLIAGMADDNKTCVFQISIYDDKDGSTIIYGDSFNGDEDLSMAQAQELFDLAVVKFRTLLLTDKDADLNQRVEELAKTLGIEVIGNY